MGALLARGPTRSSHWLSSSWQPLCWQSQSPLLKLLLLQRPRLIPTFCMEATMDIHMHMEDIMDIWDMDIGAEREDQLKQNLLLNLKLIPKLILIFCMEDIMDMDLDIMDILMLMDIWDIGAERGGLLKLKLKLNLLLILRLILIFSMVDIMDMVMDYTEDIMDTLMLTGVNVEECQLNSKIL